LSYLKGQIFCGLCARIADISGGALPFVVGMVALVGLVMAYPQAALWLPNYVMGKG
jgi:TRAP-type mannitol/chloroaromatic compound transport system permease large subunit